jgi:hypothetical protein
VTYAKSKPTQIRSRTGSASRYNSGVEEAGPQ